MVLMMMIVIVATLGKADPHINHDDVIKQRQLSSMWFNPVLCFVFCIFNPVSRSGEVWRGVLA